MPSELSAFNPISDTEAEGHLWWGWGSAQRHHSLSADTREMLSRELGIEEGSRPPADPPVPTPSRLGSAVISALTRIVGQDHVLADDMARVAHCRGKSTSDLLRIRGGDVVDAPDAVVLPASHEEVMDVLAYCADADVAVVPFGGGTSVVGGLVAEAADFAGVIAVDLRLMQALVEVDPVSMTVTLQPGLRGPRVEALLQREGLTLGHFPQSFEHGSIGGFAATRSSGQASAGYGRFDQMVVGVTLATPTGSWRLGRAPATAAGPDLRQLVLGSEGAFGVITELVLAVHRAPAATRYEGWRVANFAAGVELLRTLAQHDSGPTVVRLSDETETAFGFSTAAEVGAQRPDGCHLIVGFEGSEEEVRIRHAAAGAHLRGAGGTLLSEDVGKGWLAGRFYGPYLRDALLDAGGFVETIETATSWSGLPALYTAVRESITAAVPSTALVLCHVSHVYRTGASLYYTVIYRPSTDAIDQWAEIKKTVTDRIVLAGASITHHHAVGTVHRPWLDDEIGDIGHRVLSAIKAELDPAGIMNPGVLLRRHGES